MQNAAFTISRKLPKSAFLSKKGPFLGTEMAPTPKILSFPEIPLVELFQELRGTLWRMFQVLGVAGFCGEIILKSEKMTIYIGGTLSKITKIGQFRQESKIFKNIQEPRASHYLQMLRKLVLYDRISALSLNFELFEVVRGRFWPFSGQKWRF